MKQLVAVCKIINSEYYFKKIQKILSNKRAEEVSELKHPPVIYYDFILKQEIADKMERELYILGLDTDEKILELFNNKKEQTKIIYNKYKKYEELENN